LKPELMEAFEGICWKISGGIHQWKLILESGKRNLGTSLY
jgi:hypothetical protein